MSQTTGTGAKKIQDTDNWRDIFDIHNDTVDAYDGKIGTTALPTTAQTLTGAVAEHETDITGVNNKIGSTTLPTTAQTLTGAIDEHESDISALNSNLNDLIKVIQKQDKIPNGVSAGDHGIIAVSYDVPAGYKTSGIASIGHGYPGIGNPLSFNFGVNKGVTGNGNVAYVAYYANGGVGEQHTMFIIQIQCIKTTSNIDVS